MSISGATEVESSNLIKRDLEKKGNVNTTRKDSYNYCSRLLLLSSNL